MTDRPSADEIAELFVEYRSTKRRRTRNRLVEAHIGFAHHIAARYANRGVGNDDLHQIALLALVKAVDRYDPEVGAAFTTFAGRTIEGELKRYFRDRAWSVRVPRSTKELHLQVRKATEVLTSSLGRPPSVAEVANHLEVGEDDVVEALGAAAAFTAGSLDRITSPDGAGADRAAQLATDDELLEGTVDRVLVDRLLAELPERERTIVELRFFGNKSQSEIAEAVGVSQMHVSRLLRRAMTLMREAAGD